MEREKLTDLERLAVRERPGGQPVMHQNWGKLLFMHWRVDEKHLRPLIPDSLTIDTYDGSAWVAVTPFTMWDIRAFPPYVPPVPGLNSMHELNVRTYVHLDKVPGVWFFSLDANSSVAVMAARAFFHLPYFTAEMSLEQEAATIIYSSARTDTDAAPAEFDATWKIGETLPYAHPGSLEFFLTERYCLYSAHKQKLYRARIHHEPWPLQQATLTALDSTMLETHGLPTPRDAPLLHYAEEVSVDIWPLEKVKG